jgi:DNA polymerase-3 subunit epsilon
MELGEHPLATAEFVAVDTETNGLGGDSCELTEVGAVLVGGGELHERWASLVRTNMPLGRGIQRFTGITQDQIDQAPDPDRVLPALAEMLAGRVMVAHNAGFDRRVLRQAFDRVGLDWPEPPVLCTAALARTLLPLHKERKLGRLADALGIEVDVAHRALADAETCARILCALFPRLCANAATVADAVALVRPRRRRPVGDPRRTRRAYAIGARELPALDFHDLPQDPGVYIFRNGAGQPLYVGKSVSIRNRARAHFAPSTQRAAWTQAAELVDYRATSSELGALILENRLIKQLRPPGNVKLTRRPDERMVYLVCRLDIAFPILELAPAPAAGHAVTIGPLRGRAWAVELIEQLDSLFGLRHCGRRLPRREHPSAYGQMGRCLSPCLGDLDPNLYRRRLDEAIGMFLSPTDARPRLLSHLEAQIRQASGAQRYERAGALQRRLHRMRRILDGLDGVLVASHSRPRLLLAAHPIAAGRFDALWLAGGRLTDFGALPADLEETVARTQRAAARAARGREFGAHIPPDEVDELRILTGYLASHPDLPELALDPAPSSEQIRRFVQANGSSTTSAEPASPAFMLAPTGTSRRTKPRAIGPKRGETATLVTRPAGLSS